MAKRVLTERIVATFLQWMYEVGLPLNYANYSNNFREFIEVIGQCGPEMKPPSYHEVSVSCSTLTIEWWRLCGLETPELQEIAIKLCLTCSLSGREKLEHI